VEYSGADRYKFPTTHVTMPSPKWNKLINMFITNRRFRWVHVRSAAGGITRSTREGGN